jgi:hypothetical protein
MVYVETSRSFPELTVPISLRMLPPAKGAEVTVRTLFSSSEPETSIFDCGLTHAFELVAWKIPVTAEPVAVSEPDNWGR